MLKTCTNCLITKNETEFYFRKDKPISSCKDCTRQKSWSYRRKTNQIKGNYGRSRFEFLIGTTVNDWVVIGTEIDKSKSSRILCRCKCGFEKLVLCSHLEKKSTLGCQTCHPVHGSSSPLFRGVGEISLTYLRSIHSNALSRNIPISVTAEELWQLYVDQNGKCALTGLDITFGRHSKKKTKMQSQTASLDRIDSNTGYIRGNLQWVHKDVNIMKNRFDNSYFKHICRLVTSNNG